MQWFNETNGVPYVNISTGLSSLTVERSASIDEKYEEMYQCMTYFTLDNIPNYTSATNVPEYTHICNVTVTWPNISPNQLG